MLNRGRRKLNLLLSFCAEYSADGVAVAKDWRYDLICDYLKASPSYEAVRRQVEGHKIKMELPLDSGVVQAVLNDFGPIYKLQEPIWWKTIGMRLYGIASPMPTVSAKVIRSANEEIVSGWQGYEKAVVEIPLNLTLPAALKQLKKQLEKYEFANSLPEQIAPRYQLTTSKLRRETLQQGLDALRLYKKGMPLWRIGNRLRLIPAQCFEDRNSARVTDFQYAEQKEILAVAARRLIRTAVLVAENAARGRFPSDKPFAEALMGDYARKAGRPVGSKSPKRKKAGA